MIEITNDQNGAGLTHASFLWLGKWVRFPASLSLPFSQETLPASGLQTVFATAHSDHSIPLSSFKAITEIEMLTDPQIF